MSRESLLKQIVHSVWVGSAVPCNSHKVIQNTGVVNNKQLEFVNSKLVPH